MHVFHVLVADWSSCGCGVHSSLIKLTAMFVARNGAQFMDQLMMREQKNEMFDFLRKNHILFSYFIKLVEQYTKVSLVGGAMGVE